jgi:SAM-dependent methyltransferase
MDFNQMEKSGWSEADTAEIYARDFAKAAEMAVPALLDEVGAAPGREMLDLCCGHGIIAEGLARAGVHVVGLDFSPAMLTLARIRVPAATLVEGDAMAMPFDAGRFDGVAMGFGMPHMPDPPAAMAEARRVLKPGARFAYSVWQAAPVSGLSYVFSAGAQLGSADVHLPPGPGPTDYADLNLARPAMEAAGFGDITSQDVESFWTVDSAAAPYDYFLNGSVRGAALLRAQPEANRRAIRQAVIEKVQENHGLTAPWVVPIPSIVIAGTAL